MLLDAMPRFLCVISVMSCNKTLRRTKWKLANLKRQSHNDLAIHLEIANRTEYTPNTRATISQQNRIMGVDRGSSGRLLRAEHDRSESTASPSEEYTHSSNIDRSLNVHGFSVRVYTRRPPSAVTWTVGPAVGRPPSVRPSVRPTDDRPTSLSCRRRDMKHLGFRLFTSVLLTKNLSTACSDCMHGGPLYLI